MSENTLAAIKFSKDNFTLDILDQLRLPYSSVYVPIQSIRDAYDAIKAMQIRGAPAIAIVGAFSIVVDINNLLRNGESKTIADLLAAIDFLVTSRPTAVNLSNACEEIKKLLSGQFELLRSIDKDVLRSVFDYSVALHDNDLLNNYKIGSNGLDYIVNTLKAQDFSGPFSIMTVCNTGSLATSGHGTALGIIRTVHAELSKENSPEKFWFEHAYPLETRPCNQGAKLTTYELQYDNIPFTMICDNMVTSLISTLNKGGNVKGVSAPVKFIIAGADRVVKNGDSANKIGTYQLAAIASYFNSTTKSEAEKIKFIIAAPRTTIDYQTASGDKIVIEERPENEITTQKGPVLTLDGSVGKSLTVGVATPGIQVWNPAFDVAPHELLDCIVTEERPFEKKDGQFAL